MAGTQEPRQLRRDGLRAKPKPTRRFGDPPRSQANVAPEPVKKRKSNALVAANEENDDEDGAEVEEDVQAGNLAGNPVENAAENAANAAEKPAQIPAQKPVQNTAPINVLAQAQSGLHLKQKDGGDILRAARAGKRKRIDDAPAADDIPAAPFVNDADAGDNVAAAGADAQRLNPNDPLVVRDATDELIDETCDAFRTWWDKVHCQWVLQAEPYGVNEVEYWGVAIVIRNNGDMNNWNTDVLPLKHLVSEQWAFTIEGLRDLAPMNEVAAFEALRERVYELIEKGGPPIEAPNLERNAEFEQEYNETLEQIHNEEHKALLHQSADFERALSAQALVEAWDPDRIDDWTGRLERAISQHQESLDNRPQWPDQTELGVNFRTPKLTKRRLRKKLLGFGGLRSGIDGQWLHQKQLGEGGQGNVQLWVRRDGAGRIVDRRAVKETFFPVDQWDRPIYWIGPVGNRMPIEGVLHKWLSQNSRSEVLVHCFNWVLYGSLRMYRTYLEHCVYDDMEKVLVLHQNAREQGRNRRPRIHAYIPTPALWLIFETLVNAVYVVWYGADPAREDNDPPADDWPGAAVHLDIKPENIFLTWNNGSRWPGLPKPKLGDFGLARLVAAEEYENPRDYGGAGTFGYMAPEVNLWARDGTPVDASTDLYSVGRTMQVLMELRDPTANVIDEDLTLNTATREHYPHGLVDLVHRCLRADARSRMHVDQLRRTIRNELDAYDIAREGLRYRHGPLIHRPDEYAGLMARSRSLDAGR